MLISMDGLQSTQYMMAMAGSPSRNPFLKRLDMSLRYLILPVPVVFLRIAFWLQLTAGNYFQ